ncbi:LacI family DNA-binding transcriptional regulator [Myceligenerans pegani]|uniref:LacI family DNA-binding transcriptional regulator n=1 Tax=Myceligenerans pegani TaxID=2776917 RepID=A0ABR9N2G1_9MICO|nr:LacI family DNA-binding transcriptional regulator [Myceligenerans sp. TRM 65318]MBE1877832.1 LacI family DNA-binding transcriptional regulator [Myceligenerans sp. TRM 65318]MBE3020103.1 LacI family DNA-binding transcriptional regulator [Myceligenerans sp. TRM 65318]
MSTRNRRPTIRDVAAAAGVSRGTVSRVLNGGKLVSPEARAAVEAAIASTGYVANQHARSLATSRSNSIAFLLTEPQHLLFEDPNFSVLLRGVAEELSGREIPLLLMVAGTPSEWRQITRYVAAGHVDGVLLISSHRDNPVLADLLAHDVPVVACGVPLGYEGRVGYVAADDKLGAVTMARHLLERGRTRIAMITGPLDTSGGTLRLEGYREALGDLYDETLVATGDYSRESGRLAMAELLRRRPDLDAVFVASDLMAAGALATLQAEGRRVPDDVAVGGFDDSGVAAAMHPALTTMRQPFGRISSEMVRLLLEVMEGEEPAGIMLPTSLVKRDST